MPVVNHLSMVIFHCYVWWPEGKSPVPNFFLVSFDADFQGAGASSLPSALSRFLPTAMRGSPTNQWFVLFVMCIFDGYPLVKCWCLPSGKLSWLWKTIVVCVLCLLLLAVFMLLNENSMSAKNADNATIFENLLPPSKTSRLVFHTVSPTCNGWIRRDGWWRGINQQYGVPAAIEFNKEKFVFSFRNPRQRWNVIESTLSWFSMAMEHHRFLKRRSSFWKWTTASYLRHPHRGILAGIASLTVALNATDSRMKQAPHFLP